MSVIITMFESGKTFKRRIAGFTFVSYLVVLFALIISPCVMGDHAIAGTAQDACHENMKHDSTSCQHDCDENHCDICEIRNLEITTDKVIVDVNKDKFKKYNFPVLDSYTALDHLRNYIGILPGNLHEQIYPALHPLEKYRHLLI